ncbi:hypothetical protein [Thermostichus vulcanus]|uniref:Yip1 domain-containing protein n=1 Tax=Thermostichus vulcanus str. 'Rupite' TaxID=2813851 RepID=A0ABT0CFI5_THEVL|nr:hypothetical protein [Thermostichus vulcanus]MCJ2544120.1 hypothetical protein [Thermostichus vulcanus str. 'Rupite']
MTPLAGIFWLGLKQTQFYLWLFRREIPTSLELGGLAMVYMMSLGYVFGWLWGYLVGFVLLPRLGVEGSILAKVLVAIGIYLLWTLLVFEILYRDALRQVP